MINQVAKRSRFEITVNEIAGKRCSEYRQVIAQHQYRTLWTYAANCILGFWLIISPFLCDYKSSELAISDTASGALIILFECISFSPQRYMMRWFTPAVAIWLLFAPFVFWSPTPAVYFMDTLIACLVIAFSILLPGTPGQGGAENPGPDQPPAWTYNPSSWIRRWLGITLALGGFFISRYLAARQLGYMQHAFDPFFGDGSDKVLHSVVSRSFPISDAGFGSIAYIMEVLAGFMGDRARWRTAPWVVTTFAILVVPLGITSIVLVILQPVVVGAWCGLCLIAAAGLLISVPLAVHEIIAMGLFMVDAKRQGKNFWQLFWFGGSIVGAGATDPDRMHYSFAQRWIASVQGVTVSWAIAIQLAIGIALMAYPDIFSFGGRAADSDHLLGALVVTVAAIATAEVTRASRLLNIPLGLLLIVAAFIFARGLPVVLWSNLIFGVILMVSAFPRGEIIERYGEWNKFVK